MITKPIVMALFTLMVLAVPSGVLQAAGAQDFTNDPDQDFTQEIIDRTFQEITQDQDQDQDIDQEQDQDVEAENEADQSNEATVSQDETNNQANALVTGDNTASTTQSGSNTANENSAAAASEGGSGGDIKKAVKSEVKSSGGDSEAEAEVGIEQSVENDALTVQDSSADNNVLSNENTFGNDVAVVDQDNVADQDAVAVGVQDQDATQDQNATQDAENFNFGVSVQEAFQESIDILPDGVDDNGDGQFCLTATIDTTTEELCFATLELCEGTQAELELAGHTIEAECHEVTST